MLFKILPPIIGTLCIMLVLCDVFLTVLYARIGTGIISHPLGCLIWRGAKFTSLPLSQRRRSHFLSFAGPFMLVALVLVWFSLLAVGGGLIVWPRLGTSIQATSGATPTDFAAAIYVVGDSLTTVGTSDLAPRTPFTRLFYVLTSFTGISILTLTVTYLLEIYNSLQHRTTFALKLHVATGETGDAAELLCGLGPEGDFQSGYSHLAELAAEMAQFEEAHHFYPVIFYFRFREIHYEVSRVALVALDSIALLKSGLDDSRYAWLKESAAITQLSRATLRLLHELGDSFMPGKIPEVTSPPLPKAVEVWKHRFKVALTRMQQAGLTIAADEELGASRYAEQRVQWDRYISGFSDHLALNLEEVDPAGADPDATVSRPHFTGRRHSMK